MKVLIVEDHPPMRQLIRSVVGDLAEAVTECANGAEAVAVYAAQQFSRDDRVLMDLEMPGVDGLEATRRLRAAFPEAQIIIVTQYGDAHLRAAAREAGACGYVLKENLLDIRAMISNPPCGEPISHEARDARQASTTIQPQTRKRRRHGKIT